MEKALSSTGGRRFTSLFRDDYKLPRGSIIDLSREQGYILQTRTVPPRILAPQTHAHRNDQFESYCLGEAKVGELSGSPVESLLLRPPVVDVLGEACPQGWLQKTVTRRKCPVRLLVNVEGTASKAVVAVETLQVEIDLLRGPIIRNVAGAEIMTRASLSLSMVEGALSVVNAPVAERSTRVPMLSVFERVVTREMFERVEERRREEDVAVKETQFRISWLEEEATRIPADNDKKLGYVPGGKPPSMRMKPTEPFGDQGKDERQPVDRGNVVPTQGLGETLDQKGNFVGVLAGDREDASTHPPKTQVKFAVLPRRELVIITFVIRGTSGERPRSHAQLQAAHNRGEASRGAFLKRTDTKMAKCPLFGPARVLVTPKIDFSAFGFPGGQ
ncbi:Fatty-acid-binding protein 1 [Platanthera zijinensis]|uniref:Fatty-acid-binding protein 1 n=1 Tax=Platanthera zijinensis TaxID=2320716 RepID=A0AAP0BL47_9ASPA